MISPESRGSWREIERHLRPYVARRVGSPAEADDVLQEIFIKLQRGLGALRDTESFGGWMYRIAQNVIADSARAKARSRIVPVAELPEPDDTPNDDDGVSLRGDLTECVELFVARLPAPYREAITLTELQGLSQQAAAELLGISLSGLKSRVQRGRSKIRDMFDECCRVSLDSRGRVTECVAREPHELPADCRAAAASWTRRRGA